MKATKEISTIDKKPSSGTLIVRVDGEMKEKLTDLANKAGYKELSPYIRMQLAKLISENK